MRRRNRDENDMIKGWVIALGILTVGIIASLFVGVIDLDAGSFLQSGEGLDLLVVSRIPRTLAVLLTGASLAVAGIIMQMIVANRFVEPMTAGSGSTAALGILLITFLAPEASIALKMAAACIISLLGMMAFLAMVRRLPSHQPLLVPLVGLAYGGVVSALVTFIAFQMDLLQYLETWFNGEFSGILQGRYELLWLAGILMLLAYFVADQFAILGLGQNVSINLGLNYHQIVRLGLIIVSLISAVTVVTVGVIPFVGLVVPNIVSRWLGDNLRRTLPVTAMMGGGTGSAFRPDRQDRQASFRDTGGDHFRLSRGQSVSLAALFSATPARRPARSSPCPSGEEGLMTISRRMLLSLLLFLVCAVGFLTLNARGSWDFVLWFRGTKLIGICLVAFSIAVSTVLFQTLTHNRILTPSLMGFDSLYALLQTMLVFTLGGLGFAQLPAQLSFFSSFFIMMVASLALFGTLLGQSRQARGGRHAQASADGHHFRRALPLGYVFSAKADRSE